MNSKLSIGIIGAERERHCLYLAEEIERQGGQAMILDTINQEAFPLSLSSAGQQYGSGYRDQELEDTRVYYLRALFLPTPAFDATPIEEQIQEEGYIAYAAQRERYAAWLSFLKCLPLHGKLLVNPVDTLLIHFAKPYQIEALRQAGIPVPETLVTSSRDRVLAFAQSRQVVYKPVAGGAHCRLLEPEDLVPERLDTLRHAPAIFQEYIQGRDVRVFVLDGKAIAAFELESDEVDYRLGGQGIRAISIPDEIASMCVAACSRLNLLFSGVDLKRRPDGSYVLIECNPSPMFEGFDRHAVEPIVTTLARYLLSEARIRAQMMATQR
ncbi:ATP-grasp domain-containing protein [Paenibacillus daejeonensis]|uniref:ATP-grasp domain-containing protein n=1 Tax=Paenibacillus daejeonensis TaxID=135193 RepID=UPI0003657C6D|nr:ATP-grasp domain-containing protein [Paenibacillus daejeonensis]